MLPKLRRPVLPCKTFCTCDDICLLGKEGAFIRVGLIEVGAVGGGIEDEDDEEDFVLLDLFFAAFFFLAAVNFFCNIDPRALYNHE